MEQDGRIGQGIISLEHVTKRFESAGRVKEVVDDVSLEVKENEFVVLFGPGQCGKTTMINLIAGLELVTEGTVSVDGKKVEGPGADRGVVYQTTALFPFCTVMGNVEFGPKSRGINKKTRRERAQYFIDLVGLQGFEKSFPNQLSGGMRQRVGIARAYCNDPKVMLMDEPFGHLDAQTRYMMEEELEKIWQKEKRTVVFVTNNIEEAVYLADRIILLTNCPTTIKEGICGGPAQAQKLCGPGIPASEKGRSWTIRTRHYRRESVMREDKVKVKVKNLTKKFGDLLVLDDISFEVKEGEFLCIVGPTGCGKTTFLNSLTKLYDITAGEILVNGEPVDLKRHNIAYIFQEYSTFPWLKVEENVKYGLRIKGIAEDEVQRRADEVIAMVGLEEFRAYYPDQLSASMLQRVVIARAFAVQPELLIMDEPYGQLDISLRFRLEDELIRLWRETGTTVIFITHNIEEAVYLSETDPGADQ